MVRLFVVGLLLSGIGASQSHVSEGLKEDEKKLSVMRLKRENDFLRKRGSELAKKLVKQEKEIEKEKERYVRLGRERDFLRKKGDELAKRLVRQESKLELYWYVVFLAFPRCLGLKF